MKSLDIAPYHMISCHITSYDNISYHIISYHIISFYCTSYCNIIYDNSYHIIKYHIILSFAHAWILQELGAIMCAVVVDGNKAANAFFKNKPSENVWVSKGKSYWTYFDCICVIIYHPCTSSSTCVVCIQMFISVSFCFIYLLQLN